MQWKKLTSTAAALAACLMLMTSPALAVEDDTRAHGPMPIAIIGTLFGGLFWVVSVPFSVIIAPKHITDSFDQLVLAPWHATIGQSDDG